MSRSIWTRCAGSSSVRRLSCKAWRVVESQTVLSTRKLVDSAAEQELLETLIDAAKPPVPADAAFKHLHYLLYTSFRYPPMRHGSRFGTRHERGIWYGAIEIRTALAEVAYYRFVFLEGTAAKLAPLTVDLTAFQAAIRARRAVDLTRPPFAAYESEISSKARYEAPQVLGREMRAAGVEAFRYTSARDRERGAAVGLFEPAFARRSPMALQAWVCTASRDDVEMLKKDVFRRVRFDFPRKDFEVKEALPRPAT